MADKQRLLDKDYIPGIYGWKFIAISLLFADHLCIESGIARPVYAIPFSDGLTGVFAFFVISGYLVTRVAIKEERESGKIGLKRFFFRRALRVIPAYYFFLLAMMVFYPLSRVTFSSIIAGFTFTVNYATPHDLVINVAHIWAICVEEHFYLIWIPLLAVFKRKRAWPFIIALIVIPTILRCLSYPQHPQGVGSWWYKYSISYNNIHAVALGAGLAVFEGNERFEKIMAKARKCYAHMLALVFMVLLSPWLAAQYGFLYMWDFKPLLTSFALAVLLAIYLRGEENILTRFLDCSFLRRVGIMYYSLYLWQQPFTFGFFGRHPGWLGALESVLLALLYAGASFLCVETPFNRLRNKALR